MVALESLQGQDDEDTERLITHNNNVRAALTTKKSSTAVADRADPAGNGDNADTEISPTDDTADTADDTQSLLRPTSTASYTTNGAIDITGMVTAAPKRVIIADMLRFLFLGIPG